ncbi:unnamed protein product [Symbiodinium sp. CCMP2456]|nr:unnamed protein product [Symbiodinium sp. CCMP2456]
MELPLRAVRAIFSDIDGTLVHYAHVLERSGYSLNGADSDKDGGLAEFIHKPTGVTIPVLKVPSTTLSGGYISKKTLDLVADLRARGVIFCLLTGARTRTFMKRHETRTIPFPDFGVCEGGGKIFTFHESTGAAELDESWIQQFAHIAGDWQQLDTDPLERQGLLWDCFREMHKAGYNLDAVSLSTGFYVDVRTVRKQKLDEDGQQAAASTEDSGDMFVSLQAEEEAARSLFCGSEGNFSDRFGVSFVMNLGKGHVAPNGCNKRKAVEYIMQKTGQWLSLTTKTTWNLPSFASQEWSPALRTAVQLASWISTLLLVWVVWSMVLHQDGRLALLGKEELRNSGHRGFENTVGSGKLPAACSGWLLSYRVWP